MTISYKLATYIIVTSLMIFGWVYAISIQITSANNQNLSAIGPEYFPNLLAILLTVLGIISIIQTAFKKETQTIKIVHFKYMVITLSVVVGFILCWAIFDYFYILSILFLSILFTIYKKKYARKDIIIHVSIACGITLAIYLLFDVAMSIPL